MQKAASSPLSFKMVTVGLSKAPLAKAAPAKASAPAPKFTAIKLAAPKARSASGLVTANRGCAQKGRRAQTKGKDNQDRQRLSGTLQLKRIRQVLDGTLSGAHALCMIFSAPGMWLGKPVRPETQTSEGDFLLITGNQAAAPQERSLLDNQGFLLAC